MFNFVNYLPKAADWESAVKLTADPLVKENFADSSYEPAMINAIKEHGSYIILIPGVAMPHSRTGVLKNGLSLLALSEPVLFPDNQEVWLVLCVAATSPEEHIKYLGQISDLLGDKAKVSFLKRATSEQDIRNVLNA